MVDEHAASQRSARSLSAPGLPGEAPAQPEQAPPSYQRAFSVAAFTMKRFIVDQTLRAARQFDNDVETMMLFGVLAHLNVAHLMPPGTQPSQAGSVAIRVAGRGTAVPVRKLRDCQAVEVVGW